MGDGGGGEVVGETIDDIVCIIKCSYVYGAGGNAIAGGAGGDNGDGDGGRVDGGEKGGRGVVAGSDRRRNVGVESDVGGRY